MHILLLEPDRVVARCITREFDKHGDQVAVISRAEEAIAAADEQKPDIIIAELSLPGHSVTEFLYEFRTYPDWRDVPIIIYSSLQPTDKIIQSRDWKLLGVTNVFYKPDISIQSLCEQSRSHVTV